MTVPRKPALAGIDPYHLLDWEEDGDDDNIEVVTAEGDVYGPGWVRGGSSAAPSLIELQSALDEARDGVEAATPFGVRVETLGVQVAPPVAEGAAAVASPCPGPDPFNTRTVVGCVTLAGTAGSRAAVGDFVVNLGHLRLSGPSGD